MKLVLLNGIYVNAISLLLDIKAADGYNSATDHDAIVNAVHAEMIDNTEKYHSSIMQVK